MAGIGRVKLFGGASTGRLVQALFNLDNVLWLPIGATIDWSSVAASSGDTTYPDGVLVADGKKALRYGQVLTRITTAHAQTITVSGTPTGGSFYIRVQNPSTGEVGSVEVAYNAATSAVQAALETILGSGNVAVTGSGALPGNVHTATLQGTLRYATLPLMQLGENGLTGGTNPTVAFAVSAGGKAGYYGPYDSAASDGRQTLTRGAIGILNQTIVEEGAAGLGFDPTMNTENVGIFYGGTVWRDRVIATDSTHSLSAGPTWTELMAALPEINPKYGS